MAPPGDIVGPVALIKIDVDGTPPRSVLDAFDRIIRVEKPIIVVECKPDDKKTFGYLLDQGYGLQWRFNASPTYIWEPV